MYTFPDGAKYVGEWEDDLRNGYGTLILPNGDKFKMFYKNDERTSLNLDLLET